MDQDVSLPLLLADVLKSSIHQTSTVSHAQMVTSQTEPRKFARELNLNVDQNKSLVFHQAATLALLAHPARNQLPIEDHARPLSEPVLVLRNSLTMAVDVTHAQLVKLLTQMTPKCACHHFPVLELTKFSEMRTIATPVSIAPHQKFQV
jgi:hypothetical protein